MASLPDPGSLDLYVTIQQATSSVGASGVPQTTWSTLATVPMMRGSVTGFERFASQLQMAAAQSVVWTMFYRDDMDPDLVNVPAVRRLRWQSTTYDITAARLVASRGAIELTAIAKSL